jgi:hypothetical protein
MSGHGAKGVMGRMGDLMNIIGKDRRLLSKPGGNGRRGVILASCS